MQLAETAQKQAEAERIEAEMAQVCGVLNATTGRLLALVAQALESGAYQQAGIHSPEQWVSWKCGVSRGRARRLVAMARRLPELPKTRESLESGALTEDQVAVVCRHAPAAADAEVAAFATQATVSQLSRTLRDYTWEPPADDTEDQPAEERRRARFVTTEEGWWRLSALLPLDQGALVERALDAALKSLAELDGAERPTWADALVAVADRSLSPGATDRRHGDRHLVVLHMRTDTDGGGPRAHLHLGAPLPDALRRLLGCDGRVAPVWEAEGVALSVGRARRIVAERTRVVIEERDGGCRVPGCDRRACLQVHHIEHWEDGGRTDTANLVLLCSHHHRLHHRGQLGISGDADDPDGLSFTDHRGRPLTRAGPAPPGQLKIAGTWAHPSGERLDRRWVHFNRVPQPA